MTASRSVSAHSARADLSAGNHSGDALRTYVLDTSVLLSDPWAVTRFAEHHVVLPLVVISELEGKRHHHELGWFARESLRMLDDLRIEYSRLDRPVPIGTENGTLQVELNHTDPAVLPVGFRTDSNDSRILACALNLAAEGKDVVLVSKDIPLRVKAGAVGLPADEYHAHDVVPSGWTGMTELDVASTDIDELFNEGFLDLDEARRVITALAGLVTASVEYLGPHAGPIREGLQALQRAFREASSHPDEPGKGPGEKFTGPVY